MTASIQIINLEAFTCKLPKATISLICLSLRIEKRVSHWNMYMKFDMRFAEIDILQCWLKYDKQLVTRIDIS